LFASATDVRALRYAATAVLTELSVALDEPCRMALASEAVAALKTMLSSLSGAAGAASKAKIPREGKHTIMFLLTGLTCVFLLVYYASQAHRGRSALLVRLRGAGFTSEAAPVLEAALFLHRPRIRMAAANALREYALSVTPGSAQDACAVARRFVGGLTSSDAELSRASGTERVDVRGASGLSIPCVSVRSCGVGAAVGPHRRVCAGAGRHPRCRAAARIRHPALRAPRCAGGRAPSAAACGR
jgi:hypothetical protein